MAKNTTLQEIKSIKRTLEKAAKREGETWEENSQRSSAQKSISHPILFHKELGKLREEYFCPGLLNVERCAKRLPSQPLASHRRPREETQFYRPQEPRSSTELRRKKKFL